MAAPSAPLEQPISRTSFHSFLCALINSDSLHYNNAQTFLRIKNFWGIHFTHSLCKLNLKYKPHMKSIDVTSTSYIADTLLYS